MASLRNVFHTGPLFHNGGMKDAEQGITFYNRGADFTNENQQNLDPDIQPLFLTQQQRDDLLAFLISLTDPRLSCKRAPFDHPEIFLPNGAPGDENGAKQSTQTPGQAVTAGLFVAAVGGDGLSGPSAGLEDPLCVGTFADGLSP